MVGLGEEKKKNEEEGCREVAMVVWAKKKNLRPLLVWMKRPWWVWAKEKKKKKKRMKKKKGDEADVRGESFF
jgi:hypothetical protein